MAPADWTAERPPTIITELDSVLHVMNVLHTAMGNGRKKKSFGQGNKVKCEK